MTMSADAIFDEQMGDQYEVIYNDAPGKSVKYLYGSHRGVEISICTRV